MLLPAVELDHRSHGFKLTQQLTVEYQLLWHIFIIRYLLRTA